MNYCGRCKRKYDRHGNGHADNCPIRVKDRALIERLTAEIRAEPKDEPELIFIRYSKFAGRCRSKDCRNLWGEGEAIYWNPRTREVFCGECGDEMSV